MWQMWAGGAGAPFAPVVALAVEEGPPIPAARLGPIHVMGRAVHSRVHTLSGHIKACDRLAPGPRMHKSIRLKSIKAELMVAESIAFEPIVAVPVSESSRIRRSSASK